MSAGCGRIGVELHEAPSAAEGGVERDATADDAGRQPDLDALVADEAGTDAAVETGEAGGAEDAQLEDVGMGAQDGASTADASDADVVDAQACAIEPGCDVCAIDPNAHVPDDGCGIGYCRTTNTPSRCISGVEVACVPGMPRAASDTTCDGVDDDCDGTVDEQYTSSATNCGRGVCSRAGMRTCRGGAPVDSCVAGAPTSALDDATGLGNGLDDDCDGRVDEDIPGCDTTPRAFAAGTHADIAVPAGCGRATVRIWGAGGAGGDNAGVLGSGGEGGAGGYVSHTAAVSGSISLWVGQGASNNCDSAGANQGASTYNGGSGGTGTGAAGSDGMAAGGGAGGAPSTGRVGGRGHFGGGGGGQGSGGLGASGNGGGGGAASVLSINGMRVAVAGGGGGGGGAQSVSILGTLAAAGGSGGSGCGGAGLVATANGGGGGGGGTCVGTSTQAGTGRTPAFSADIPAGLAAGGARGCTSGGAGYAIVTFSR
jgi:hypothetical protein